MQQKYGGKPLMRSKLLELFTENLRNFLRNSNLNQSEFADRLGVSRQSVTRYVAGGHSIGLEKVDEICSALGVSPAYLVMTPEERAIWDSKQAATSDNEKILMQVIDNQNKRIAELEARLGGESPKLSGSIKTISKG